MKKMIPGKDRPYRSNELFRIILEQLKEKNLLPDILDYYTVEDRDSVEVRYYGWNTIGIVKLGSIEGIYLDIYAIGEVSQRENQNEKVRLGCFKTLRTGLDDFKRMGDINAEIVFLMRNFLENNLHDFEWSGYDVTFYNKAGAEVGCYSTQNIEQAESSIRSKFIRGDKYDYAVIVDMRDRKIVKKIKREEI